MRPTSRSWRRASGRSPPRWSRSSAWPADADGCSTSARRPAPSSPPRSGAAGTPRDASQTAGSVNGALATTASASGRAACSIRTTHPASFDVVTLWDVIEHTPDPRAVLDRCRELLKPGGLLIVNYPDIGSWIARAARPAVAVPDVGAPVVFRPHDHPTADGDRRLRRRWRSARITNGSSWITSCSGARS